MKFINLYINLACLFVSNKRQNGWTDRAQFFCGISRDPREVLWMIKIKNKKRFLFLQKILNPENQQIFFTKSTNEKQWEHVHNWNRRWAQIATWKPNFEFRTPFSLLYNNIKYTKGLLKCRLPIPLFSGSPCKISNFNFVFCMQFNIS